MNDNFTELKNLLLKSSSISSSSLSSSLSKKNLNKKIEKEKEEKLNQYEKIIKKETFFGDFLKSLKQLSKAKTAKIIRNLINYVGKIPNSTNIQIKMCKETIEWAKIEKRSFLRQRIESKLSALYFSIKEYSNALKLIGKVASEVKKIDDKDLLVEIHLLESKILFNLRNVSKAKAALVSARTNATSIYCPPLLQAEIDMQSGIIHSEEKDYKTAFSYFIESFEGFSSLSDNRAIFCLKYMLMCKIISNSPEDVQNILMTKKALQYSGVELEAMENVAKAYKDRSLHKFENVLKKYKKELQDDPIMKTHLNELYDNLLEQHLLKIIEPFERVQISHIAKLIGLEKLKVEKKLSQMILDNVLNGVLDQGNDCLLVYEENQNDDMYPACLQTTYHMNDVLDSLFERAKVLTK